MSTPGRGATGVVYYSNLIVAGLALGAIYALFGLGITVIYKATKVPNFAHSAIGMVGAYVFFKTWNGQNPPLRRPGISFKIPFTHIGWSFVPPKLPAIGSFLLALIVVGLLGLPIERLGMGRIGGAPTLTMSIVPVALLAIIPGFASDWFSPEAEIVDRPFGDSIVRMGKFAFGVDSLGILAVAVVLTIGLTWFFKYSTLGVAVRATADSREVSRLLGID